jgi:transposase
MAPKIRPYDRHQITMMALSLDDLVEPDHEVRALWAYVERMDLTALFDSIRTRLGRKGAPTYDPRILMALWLYATARGVGSARELEQMCRESLPFRWLCADDVPNYHTLCDFRTGHGELLDKLLSDNLATLVSEQLLDVEEMMVAHDGLRVRTSAGRSSFRRRPTLEQALHQARERVEQLKQATGNESRQDRALAARQRAARERQERVEKALEKMKTLEEKRRKKDRKEPRVSTTDPEAMRMKMGNGGYDPGYNIQYTTETKARVITSVTLGECGSDFGLLLPAIEEHRRRTGRLPARVLADAGFVDYDDIIALEEMGCQTLVPDERGETNRGRSHPALSRWRSRMAEEESVRVLMTIRPATAEWTNAQLRNRSFHRITVRGRLKAWTIAMWQALTHNILRTITMRKQLPAPA